ncbi:adenosine deaminase/editase [Xylariales sp. PMI_506]|nr:adenosine deaminase/editase [Xylariales sp. PMI_506]
MSHPTPDDIATLVLQHFAQLPAKRKPLVRDNGMHEWVPLSAIVAHGPDIGLRCLSLATGMKCLPHSKLPRAQGAVLHDWHAEVLAIRAFNRFVLDELYALAAGTITSSAYLVRRRRRLSQSEGDQPWQDEGGHDKYGTPEFTWREDVHLHMYCSEAPCGDASMELTMAAQEDATPWEVPGDRGLSAGRGDGEDENPVNTATTALPGRAYFSRLGLVRRKPARPDAPPTLSKSCSDKLSLRQCVSLLSSVTSLLVCPSNAYISTLVLPRSQYSRSGCLRAFSAADGAGEEGEAGNARMATLRGHQWQGGYAFRPFRVLTTDKEFEWSRRSVDARVADPGEDATSKAASAGSKGRRLAASNLAVAWTAHGMEEATLGGTLQGRKAFDPRGASFVSRSSMWMRTAEVARLLVTGGNDAAVQLQDALTAESYRLLKESALLQNRGIAKADARAQSLRGWVKNEGDEDFGLMLTHPI